MRLISYVMAVLFVGINNAEELKAVRLLQVGDGFPAIANPLVYFLPVLFARLFLRLLLITRSALLFVTGFFILLTFTTVEI